jgi:ankyrin repeat protein
MTFQELISRAPDEHWIEDVRAYLSSGGDINRADKRQGWSLLHIAAEHQQAEVIRFLAANGANLNMQDPNGWTPLHLAVDADIDGAIQNGAEPQMVATRALIKAGADPTIRDKEGRTPRDIASLYGGSALALYDSIRQERAC